MILFQVETSTFDTREPSDQRCFDRRLTIMLGDFCNLLFLLSPIGPNCGIRFVGSLCYTERVI